MANKIKSKSLLYSFKARGNTRYTYWYETDNLYFKANKPTQSVLNKITDEKPLPQNQDTINNPWQEWSSNDIQKIISSNGVCINYLKTTDTISLQKKEDFNFLETYAFLVDNFDVSRAFGFSTIVKWHKMIFEEIYPFAGDLRTVQMTKGEGEEAWVWRVEFLQGIPDFDELVKSITSKDYDDIDDISMDLSTLVCDFLFIHPFREGNGRLSRLICDIILAKNGFPMIGLKLKSGDNYIQRIHDGYLQDYEPLKELIKEKILDEITNG